MILPIAFFAAAVAVSCGAANPESPPTNKAKVFGVGLSKTGTTSMAEAMRQLGYETLHTDQSLAPFMHHVDVPPNLENYYDDVDSVWDIPTAGYYTELLQAYPDAKFVLTVRDSQEWFESFKTYLEDFLFYKWGCEIPERVQRLHEVVYGSRFPTVDWIRAFEQHTRDVQALFADRPDQLLMLDVSHGNAWLKLCPFLGVQEGPCDGSDLVSLEFPHENNAADHGVAKECPADAMQANRNQDSQSNFAYVTLMCDPAEEDQAEYVRMLLVLGENIREFDQDNDIVTMVYGSITDEQWQLLSNEGFKLYKVGGVGSALSNPPPDPDSRASDCYRAKMRALQFTQYDKVIFMDTDLLLKQDVQNLFTWPGFTAYSGYEAPLNAGFFVMEPSHKAFADIRDIAKSDSFNPQSGWLDYGSFPHWRETGESSDWSFWCAHTDQGLLYYYFDKVVEQATLDPELDSDEVFTHFTGMNKPFLHNPSNLEGLPLRFRESVVHWYELWSRVEERLKERELLSAFGSSNSVANTERRIRRVLHDKDVYGGKKGKKGEKGGKKDRLLKTVSTLGSPESIEMTEDRIRRVLHDKDVYGGKKGKKGVKGGKKGRDLSAVSSLGSVESVEMTEDRLRRVLHDKDVYGGKKGKKGEKGGKKDRLLKTVSTLGSPESVEMTEDRIKRVLNGKDVYGGKKGKKGEKGEKGGKKDRRLTTVSALGSHESVQKAEDRIRRVLHDKDVYGGKKGKKENKGGKKDRRLASVSALGSSESVRSAEDRIRRVLHDKDVYGGKKRKKEKKGGKKA